MYLSSKENEKKKAVTHTHTHTHTHSHTHTHIHTHSHTHTYTHTLTHTHTYTHTYTHTHTHTHTQRRNVYLSSKENEKKKKVAHTHTHTHTPQFFGQFTSWSVKISVIVNCTLFDGHHRKTLILLLFSCTVVVLVSVGCFATRSVHALLVRMNCGHPCTFCCKWGLLSLGQFQP